VFCIQKSFTKVLICGAVHHFDNIPTSLGKIINCLPKNGSCLILTRQSIGWPLPFSRLQLQDIAGAPDYIDVILSYLTNRNDVVTEVTNEDVTFEIPKSRWYNMIRGRFMSNFNKYTDEELEESIKELDDERFPGVKDDECVTIPDHYIAIKLSKQ
jgi:hypothetical protein